MRILKSKATEMEKDVRIISLWVRMMVGSHWEWGGGEFGSWSRNVGGFHGVGTRVKIYKRAGQLS